jgi:hypothetical protein
MLEIEWPVAGDQWPVAGDQMTNRYASIFGVIEVCALGLVS